MKQKNSGNKKRVTFLMPYIDFCFMLIIIFVGMLSIAYFEPFGLTDLETVNDPTVDNKAGQHDVKPGGVQNRPDGTGEARPAGVPKPLENKLDYRTGGKSRPARGGLGAEALAGQGPGGRGARNQGRGNGTETGIGKYTKPPPEHDEKELLEELERLKKENEMLKENQGKSDTENEGVSNHLYLDLRSNED